MTISTIIHVTKEVLTDGLVIHPETEHPTNSGNLSVDVNKFILLYILFFVMHKLSIIATFLQLLGLSIKSKRGLL